jgi:hypothetical protein
MPPELRETIRCVKIDKNVGYDVCRLFPNANKAYEWLTGSNGAAESLRVKERAVAVDYALLDRISIIQHCSRAKVMGYIERCLASEDRSKDDG